MKRISSKLWRGRSSLLAVTISALALTTYANEPVNLGPTPLDSVWMQYSLEDVVVMGIKEQSKLRVEPISSTSLGVEQLQVRNVNSVKEVLGMVPNFIMIDRDTPHTSSVLVRGIGSKLQPAVVMYVDGIPHFEKSTFDLSLNDVEQLEFLRGPQGTTFGRNAIGGVILMQTRSPFKYQGNKVRVGYGRFNEVRVDASRLARVGTHWAYSIAGNYQHLGGYLVNSFDDSSADKADKGGVNAKLEYSPNENTLYRLTQSVDYVKQGAFTYGTVDMETMKVPTISLDHPSEYTRLIYDGGLSASYHSDQFLLKGQLSSHIVNASYDVDQDGSPKDLYYALQKEKQRLFSQELSMIGKNEGWYNWSFGLFAFEQQINRDVDVTINKPKSVLIKRLNDQFTWGAALYHQSKFSLSEEFKIEAGVRVDYEKSRLAYSEDKNGKKSESDNSLPFVQVSPKVSFQYFIVPDFQVYATVTKGYVTGGFNTVYVGTENRSYDAEHSWNYEVGAKGEIIPGRLTTELVAFAVTTRDKQLSKIIPVTGQVTYNAGASRSIGLEAALDAQLTKQWGLSALYGFTNAKFTDYVTDKGIDFGGKYLPFVPEYTLAVNTQYRIPFKGQLLDSATIHLGYRGIGDMYWHEDNKVKQDFYQLLDASLSFKRAGFTCTLWGTNLLNSYYLGYFYTQSGRNMGKPGAPLKAGVTVELNF